MHQNMIEDLKKIEKHIDSLPKKKQGMVKKLGFKLFKKASKIALKKINKHLLKDPDNIFLLNSKKDNEKFIKALDEKNEDVIEKYLIQFGWLKR